jgi:hypothetical protein
MNKNNMPLGLGKTFFEVRKHQPDAEAGKFILDEC